MSTNITKAVIALRVPWGGYWKWSATANGVTVEVVTGDQDLMLMAEPLATSKIEGVALIDDRRQVYAAKFRPTIPRRFEGMASGDIRDANDEDGAP